MAAPAFVICECFHFWHLVKLAEANQAEDFPATRRLAPTYAQCSVPSINSKSNSGVNPKERSNFRTLCLPWRVSQRGKEWLWLTLGTQTLVAAIPGSCPTTCTLVWADTTKEFSHLDIPDSHHQLIRNKTTEKVFSINHEANRIETFLISRNKVKYCPLNLSSLTSIYNHMYILSTIENIVLILSQEFFTTLKS